MTCMGKPRSSQVGTNNRGWKATEILTIMIDLLFHARLAVTVCGILTDILEVLCHLVHLVSLEVRYYDVDLVAASVMHAAKEHQLGELRGDRGRGVNFGRFAESGWTNKTLTMLNITGIIVSRFMDRWW